METKKTLKETEELIIKAMRKIGGKKENELCRYLPMKSGGYMHHFTFRKMKSKQPQELISFLEKFILQAEKPVQVAPKQRAPRGSRKRRDNMNFSRTQIERMLSIARLAGDREIISILSPRRSLAQAKRDLILAIRQNRYEPELWNQYAEAIQSHQLIASAVAEEQGALQG